MSIIKQHFLNDNWNPTNWMRMKMNEKQLCSALSFKCAPAYTLSTFCFLSFQLEAFTENQCLMNLVMDLQPRHSLKTEMFKPSFQEVRSRFSRMKTLPVNGEQQPNALFIKSKNSHERKQFILFLQQTNIFVPHLGCVKAGAEVFG